MLTASPGATTSGLMRPSRVGPYELNADTVSTSAYPFAPSKTSPSAPVVVNRVSPDAVAPTARAFLPIAGVPIVHTVRLSLMSPSLPAANISRFSGFCEDPQIR